MKVLIIVTAMADAQGQHGDFYRVPAGVAIEVVEMTQAELHDFELGQVAFINKRGHSFIEVAILAP